MTLTRPIPAVVLLLLGSLFSIVASQDEDTIIDVNNQATCRAPTPSVGSARAYKVGGNSWHIPVLDYLTEVVGPQFDPPISFYRESANPFLQTQSVAESLDMGFDMMVAHPYATSCFETEGDAVSFATQIMVNQFNDGSFHNHTMYGSVLYVLDERKDINTLEDIKGKKLGSNRIAALATHLCYDILLRNGIHHLQDPEQTIFFRNSETALEAVLEGKVDVGCAATSVLEKYVDPVTGEPLDMSRVRILNPQDYKLDGEPVPFVISSVLVPHYQFVAFPHVEQSVVTRFQKALLDMRDHSDVAPSLYTCLEGKGCFRNDTACLEECFQELPDDAIKNCDTTADLAIKAFEALQESGLVGFVEPLNNLKLRDIQESTGFMNKNPVPECVRIENIMDAVTCPPGHFVRTSDEIVQQCNVSGWDCYENDCICSPCVKAYEVDFFPLLEEQEDQWGYKGSGCSKFSICGRVEQEHTLSFRALDNKERLDATMTGAILTGDEEEFEIPFTFERIPGTFQYKYDFFASNMRAGQKIIKIRINDEEIPESPFRIKVMDRDCGADTGDDRRQPDDWGQCVCKNGMVELFEECIPLAVLIPAIIGPALVLFLVAVALYVKYKRDQSDSVWKVDPDELHFEKDPRVLGQGKFGLVLLAEYRGTAVAVKQAFPAGRSKKRSPSTSFASSKGTGSVGMISVESSGEGSFELNEKNESLQKGRGSASCDSSSSQNGVSHSVKKSSAAMKKDFIEEMRLLSKLRHPNIATVMGAVISNKSEPKMVMEYMEMGSLYDLLHNESMILEYGLLVGMLQDVASGLRFLHSSDPPVLHGDLKSRNILVDDKLRAKVADFGLSRRGSPRKDKARGTPYWMAPELLRGESSNTPESDVYSFGIVMYEAFARKEPYEGEPYDDVLRLVASANANKRPPVPPNCPAEARNMMKACLGGKPENRPTTTELDIRLRAMDSESLNAYDMMTSLQKKKSEASRTDTLLEQMFPSHIAEALKEGRKVEPENHEEVTIVFSDIVGYTDIARTMTPNKVSDLLDRLYGEFDQLCDRLKVFKVETIGDAYMTVTNLEKNQPYHASLAARFAVEAMEAASKVLIDVDDPSAGYIQCRFGMHTGPVVTHVVGTRNARFSLIGDTVNTASRMESNSKPGKIQCSEDSYSLLSKQQKHEGFTIEKRGVINVKGKGNMVTYWIVPAASEDMDRMDGMHTQMDAKQHETLIEWNVQIMEKFVTQVATHNKNADHWKDAQEQAPPSKMRIGSPVDRTKSIVPFPYKSSVAKAASQGVQLDSVIKSQISEFVMAISHMYRKHAFHNFEHASHVTMSAVKLMESLPASNAVATDPLARLAIVLACLCHDVDHPGVPNTVQVAKHTDLALMYGNKSVAEQNAIELAWGLFEDSSFEALRTYLCPTADQLERFHQLFVKALLATDIMDKDLIHLRLETYQQAFVENSDTERKHDLQGNATLELVMQAADVAHTMQQWAVFQKWNLRLYAECTHAHEHGQTIGPTARPPSDGWFMSELGFFDFVVLPLAQRMRDIGLPSSYLTFATQNEKQWEEKGRDLLEEMKGTKLLI